MSPDEILEFWFGVPADTQDLMAKVHRWFEGGDELDREVVKRFGATVGIAVAGGLEEWRSSPRGLLALVILLDQFTRNAFRGSARMYAGDFRAQQLALDSFADGTAEQLAYIERLFLSMPLLHAERAALQKREAEIARALAAEAPGIYKPMSAMHLEQSAKYSAVIARFGRFPHRNAVLGRTSTAAEIEFLADWSETAPPSYMRPVTGR